MQCPPRTSDPRSSATKPKLLIKSITTDFASVSSPDVKSTVLGLLGEKSCIHAIGILLIDLTNLAPGAISATISLDVRPFNASIDLVTPWRLTSGLLSMWALVASMRIRPRQSIPLSASGTLTQFVARIVTSHSAACCFVPAAADGPRSEISPVNDSGPLELDTMIMCPPAIRCRPNVFVTVPAPMKPIIIEAIPQRSVAEVT